MTARLYQRRARLLFGLQISADVAGFTVDTDGASGLRIVFSVTRTTDRKANSGKIEVYNLNAENRGRMDGNGARRVVLEAGYQDTMAGILCADRVEVRHRREGNDWVSTIEGGDGIRSLQTFMGGSYSPGVTARVLLDAVIAAAQEGSGLTLATRISPAAQTKLQAKTYARGHVFVSGTRVSDALQQVCVRAGCRVSVQDCAVEVLTADEVASGQAILLSPSTGLIGVPEHVTQRNDQGQIIAHYLKGTALLMPGLAPSRLVSVKSDTESANVLITRVDHSGDTHGQGQSWVTKWEGKIL